MKKIFISYRRDDSAVFTGRLYDRLSLYYGADAVFLDIDSIRTAQEFTKVVEAELANCKVVLAVIGQRWEGSPGNPRRIDNPEDFVRLEIEQAIAQNKPIVPVYFDDRSPLTSADLPPSLQKLVYTNAATVDSGRDFEHHVQTLRNELNRIVFPTKPQFWSYVIGRFGRKYARAFLLYGIFLVAMFLMRDAVGNLLITRAGVNTKIAELDPHAFPKKANYELIHGLPNRATLTAETELPDSIRQSQKTFDMFALTASGFFTQSEAIQDAIGNGVHFRILILDQALVNEENVLSYISKVRSDDGKRETTRMNAKVSYASFQELERYGKNSGKGKIELRVWRGPFMNSFWVRDGKSADNGLGHIEISYYGDALLDPSIRFGSLSPKMIASLQTQFDYLWERSRPYSPPASG